MIEARPETRYARSGDVHIAYQQFGSGDLDLVLINGFVSHVELLWEHEGPASFLSALASFARVMTFDRRGTGLSDPVARAPTLEERMDDVRAVMDAVGVQHAALLGLSEGASMGILFAATYPERVQALVSWGGLARSTAAPDYPYALPAADLIASGTELLTPYWGEGAILEVSSPSVADDPVARRWSARLERASASPGMLRGMVRTFLDIDVRHVVPSVHVPTLVLHRVHDRLVNVRHSRWLAEHLPNARLVELPGDDHTIWFGDTAAALSEIQEFLTGSRAAPEPDRVLATVLFTDIVESTRTAAELGDRRWRELLGRHAQATHRALERFGGREIKSMGDGVMATFDGPARGIHCAEAAVDAAHELGLRIRAGLHTGECEAIGDDLGGIAVHIAARVSALAGPDEILVSRTVRDLVAGSGIRFEDRGRHQLRGVPDEWELLAVER
ncbi:MAG TPA: adenylate/guanylate cyclase domain-containing protein [Solirubrobacteraceae bacterium]